MLPLMYIICVEGERLWSGPPKFVDTIAEGIRTQQCGQLTFPILVDHIEKDVFTVVGRSNLIIMQLIFFSEKKESRLLFYNICNI